jgi:ferredoxin
VRLQALLDRAKESGYTLIGPTVRDGAVVYEEIDGVDDLPTGWVDVQDGGSYRLERSAQPTLFGHTVGPQSWKKFLHPPDLRLFGASNGPGGLEISGAEEPAPRYAFLGARSCELAAIAIQDRVFLDGQHVDAPYRRRRAETLLIAVQCGRAAATCFCASMGTGPRAESGFDLALTELLDAQEHGFVVEVGSTRGAEIVAGIATADSSQAQRDAARAATDEAAGEMTRAINPLEARDLLGRSGEHPRWRETAARCLSCGNCTMVCPTCFCTTVEDSTSLDGAEAERHRKWDSCFSTEFTFIHGGSVRTSTRSRYRQWITHKLSAWYRQFDSSGCVGCGRCITWCPVGIDITEELAAMR